MNLTVVGYAAFEKAIEDGINHDWDGTFEGIRFMDSTKDSATIQRCDQYMEHEQNFLRREIEYFLRRWTPADREQAYEFSAEFNHLTRRMYEDASCHMTRQLVAFMDTHIAPQVYVKPNAKSNE